MSPLATTPRHSFREMVKEFLREGSLRKLVLDGAAITSMAAGSAFIVLYAMFGMRALDAVDTAILAFVTVPLACLGILAAIGKFDDQEFILFLKTSGSYNTLELQFAFYQLVSLAATVTGISYYFVRSLASGTWLVPVTAMLAITMVMWSTTGTYLAFQTRRKYEALHAEMIEILGPK